MVADSSCYGHHRPRDGVEVFHGLAGSQSLGGRDSTSAKGSDQFDPTLFGDRLRLLEAGCYSPSVGNHWLPPTPSDLVLPPATFSVCSSVSSKSSSFFSFVWSFFSFVDIVSFSNLRGKWFPLHTSFHTAFLGFSDSPKNNCSWVF